ncbi:MAG TPA: DUF2497 domain-containing protein [Xanthobacteraceae bacterium]|nr:DUF2497 domain-containing protein [Xanthobacteraceae bacterium]
MTQPAKSNEPSMEEILASIRRIIADDDATKSAHQAPEAPKPVAPVVRPAVPPPRMPAAPPRVTPPPVSPVEAPAAVKNAAVDEQSADILELTESMAAPMPAPAAPPAAAPAPVFRTIDGGSDVGFDDEPEKPAPQAAADITSRLLSRSTTAAVDSAFNSLAQTVLVQNAKTLEDLVREMLRPMLKAWLDENLPAMVERLVRAEIERVSRGR